MSENQPDNLSKIENPPYSNEMLEVNKAILQKNQEIAESLKYIKNHFRFQLIMTAIKWFIFAALIVFGVISLGSILSGLSETYLSAISGK